MKITNTEDLRAELDKFSLEQERDRKEKEVNKEIAVLTETLSDINDTIGKLSPLADALKEASAVHIPKDVESQLITLAKAQGTLAADTFKSKVEATVKKAKMADKRVSIPLPAAYCLFIVFFFLAAFLGLVIAANIFLFHSMELWKLIGFSVGGMVVMCAAILYAGHQRRLVLFRYFVFCIISIKTYWTSFFNDFILTSLDFLKVPLDLFFRLEK